jgi:hypothetical protein
MTGPRLSPVIWRRSPPNWLPDVVSSDEGEPGRGYGTPGSSAYRVGSYLIWQEGIADVY